MLVDVFVKWARNGANDETSVRTFSIQGKPVCASERYARLTGACPSHLPPTSPESDRPKSGASNLPLYQPPAPLLSQSQSPDTTRRLQSGVSVLPTSNGVSSSSHAHENAASPATNKEATPSSKRKRDSTSATPGTASKSASGKKVKAQAKADGPPGAEGGGPNGEEQSMELARALQQEDLGLRRRSR